MSTLRILFFSVLLISRFFVLCSSLYRFLSYYDFPLIINKDYKLYYYIPYKIEKLLLSIIL